METFIKEYGSSVLIVVAILVLISLIVLVINSDATQTAFQNLITTFMGKANAAAGLE